MLHPESGRTDKAVTNTSCRRGMFSFGGKREPEKCIALCGRTFCLFSACKDAPLGQRQGGVFRLPPPYLWTPPTPQRVKGCTPLTILKKKSKHKKASAAPVGAIALTLFSLLHLWPLSRCATAPPRGSEPSQALPRQLSQRESQGRRVVAEVLGVMRKFPVVLLPLPLGEVAVSEAN